MTRLESATTRQLAEEVWRRLDITRAAHRRAVDADESAYVTDDATRALLRRARDCARDRVDHLSTALEALDALATMEEP